MYGARAVAPSKTYFRFILFFIQKHWVKFFLIQLLWFGWSLDQTVFPWLFGKIIDGFTSYSGSRSVAWDTLKNPIFIAIALWVGIEISFRLGGLLSAVAFSKLQSDIRMYMFGHMHDQSQSYFSDHFAGNISTKISDMVDNSNQSLQLIIYLFMPTFVAVCISSVVFYTLNPFFAFLLIGWALIHVGISLAYASRCSHYSRIHSETRSQLNGRIVDSLTNYFSVKVFSNKKYELHYAGILQDQEFKQNKGQFIYVEKVRLVLGILTFAGPGIGLNAYAYWSWVHHQISVGDIVIIFNTSWNIVMMLWWASIELPNFYRQIGICHQALSLLKAPISLVDAPDATCLKVTKGGIEFEKVCFRYEGAQPLFRNKSVTIYPGEKIGLVGYSGSGKTTFVNLILRLFDVQSGSIRIDKQDIAKVTQESLRQSINLIPQDPMLFHRNLIDNIRYGRLEATDEEVFEAARKAHAHEFIMKLSEGYQTLVGERGIKLSGGQRQRIAIARAILKNAPILILDEATSALDSVTEAHIQESLSYLMRGKTTLVIAHRLSTLLHMDRLLIFDKGEIVEDGNHQSLIKKKGLYASLWKAQVGGFLPDQREKEGEES